MAKTTQKDLITEIHEKVIRMEEHLKNLNGNIQKQENRIGHNETKIVSMDKAQSSMNTWYRVKSWALTISCTALGSVVTYTFLR